MTNSRRRYDSSAGPNSESGQSLVVALVVMFALSISIAGIFDFLTSNEGQFNRDRQDQRALGDRRGGSEQRARDGDEDRSAERHSRSTRRYCRARFRWTRARSRTRRRRSRRRAARTPCRPAGSSPRPAPRRPGRSCTSCSRRSAGSSRPAHLDRRDTGLRLRAVHHEPAGRRQLLRGGWRHRHQRECLVQRQLLPERRRQPHSLRMDNKYTVYIGGNYLGRNNTNIGSSQPQVRPGHDRRDLQETEHRPDLQRFGEQQVYAYPPYLTSSSPLQSRTSTPPTSTATARPHLLSVRRP